MGYGHVLLILKMEVSPICLSVTYLVRSFAVKIIICHKNECSTKSVSPKTFYFGERSQSEKAQPC